MAWTISRIIARVLPTLAPPRTRPSGDGIGGRGVGIAKKDRIQMLDKVLTAAEAEALWYLRPGTVTAACRNELMQARKSGKVWLTTFTAMSHRYFEQPPTDLSLDELSLWLIDRNARLKEKNLAAARDGSSRYQREKWLETHQDLDGLGLEARG